MGKRTLDMAIDTPDKRLALMEWDLLWEPGLVLSETSPFSQGDQQQLLWGYPGVLWGEPPEPISGGAQRAMRRRRRWM